MIVFWPPLPRVVVSVVALLHFSTIIYVHNYHHELNNEYILFLKARKHVCSTKYLIVSKWVVFGKLQMLSHLLVLFFQHSCMLGNFISAVEKTNT